MQDPPCLVALNHVEVSGFLAPTPQLLLVHSIQIHSSPRFFLLESFNLQFWLKSWKSSPCLVGGSSLLNSWTSPGPKTRSNNSPQILKSHEFSECFQPLFGWLKYGYGSIPIDTFLVAWTSINPSYFGVNKRYQGFDPSPYVEIIQSWGKLPRVSPASGFSKDRGMGTPCRGASGTAGDHPAVRGFGAVHGGNPMSSLW